MLRRTSLLLLCLAGGLAAGGFTAQARPVIPQPPQLLPGDAGAARTHQGTWLIGARRGVRATQIAKRFGARQLDRRAGIFVVRRDRARAFASALGRADILQFAEPNSRLERQAFPLDPLAGSQWGLGALGVTSLDPPPVGATSPLLGVLESGFDGSHPDTQGMVLAGSPAADGLPDSVLHGTAVASVAAAPANGVGLSGIWPGMRVVVVTSDGSCADSVRAVYDAIDAGAKVLNMSYGFSGGGCFSHYIATQYAFGVGVVSVAAAGNEFLEGNPDDGRPAADPHVLTVAALNPDLSSAAFSNENYAIDVSAPGVGILAAVPISLDADGVQDGWTSLSGTSFAAPMTAAATAWLAALRPRLSSSQLIDLVRFSAQDLGPRGWNESFGYGLVRVPEAVRARTPRNDPVEPNDDIPWSNGRYFGRPDPPLWRGRGRFYVDATIDRFEDPADVYRAIIPGRRAVKIVLRPSFGNPQLEAYNGWAKTVFRRRGQISVSRRPGRAVERLYIRNPYRGRRTIWIMAWPSSLGAGYRLTVGPDRF